MRASGGAGNLEACRAQATPSVQRLHEMAALNAANGRANVAVAIPTEAAPKVPSRQRAARRICRAAANDHRYHRDPRQREARSQDDREVEGRGRCQADRQGIPRGSGPILSSIAPMRAFNLAGSRTPSPTPTRPSRPAAARVSRQHDGTADFIGGPAILRSRRSQEGVRTLPAAASRDLHPEGGQGLSVRRQPRDRGHPDPDGRHSTRRKVFFAAASRSSRRRGPAGIRWRARPTIPTARTGKRKLNSAAPCWPRRAASSATPRPLTRSASCVNARRSSRYWPGKSALGVQPGARGRFHRAQPRPG